MDRYCNATWQTQRFKTRVVAVGNVAVGGGHPVRIQSMTTSDTKDIEATVEQIIKLADWGCEIARVTVQGMKEADACEGIKNRLVQRGYTIPLVADIHFYPPAAMRVVDFADKVRVNPGNFVDKRATFRTLVYDDQAYAEELERIEEKFAPLVLKCKQLKRAMRIGTNHGSLSDRIMNYYGDSPRGMVESALEFTRVARKYDYHDLIFSMKASNPVVMIHAYRLLNAEMIRLGWDYPLHLGVTEAGEGEDGRVKSSIGIGSLLLDGLGDTIRVSLTEDPWHEIDPCQRLVAFAARCEQQTPVSFQEKHRDFNNIVRRPSVITAGVPLHADGSVLVTMSRQDIARDDLYDALGCTVDALGRPKKAVGTVDSIVVRKNLLLEADHSRLNAIAQAGIGVIGASTLPGALPLVHLHRGMDHLELLSPEGEAGQHPLHLHSSAKAPAVVVTAETAEGDWEALKGSPLSVIFLHLKEHRLHFARRFFDWLQGTDLKTPVILQFEYDCNEEDLVIQAGAECGALLGDGLGDGVCLEGPYDPAMLRRLEFAILQGSRMRSSKTEFISCPGCGRTLFDLQTTARIIRDKTGHLPGVKVAIMGCIVNGPGEMADADFGYVGSKTGMVDLWVGKTCVERSIPQAEAPDRLVDLIKSRGRWQEPEAVKAQLSEEAADPEAVAAAAICTPF